MIIGLVHEGDSVSYMAISFVYQAFGIAARDVKEDGSFDNSRDFFRFYSPSPAPLLIGVNCASSGLRIGDILKRDPTYVDPLVANKRNPRPAKPAPEGHVGVSSGARKYIYALMAGTNPSAADPAAQAALIGANALARKAAGFDKVIVCTIPSRTDGILANFDTAYMQPLNDLLRDAKWQAANGVDYCCDLAADARWGGVGAANDAAYFGDRVHPLVALHALVAPTYRATVNKARAALAAELPPGSHASQVIPK